MAFTSINFNSVEVKFDSTQINVPGVESLGPQAGLSGGPIKVRVDDGTLEVANQVAGIGAGDILLRAYGLGSDVLVDATVTGVTGDVTVFAADDVITTAAIGTGGNVYIRALNNDAVGVRGIVIGASVTSGSSNVLLSSDADITLNANVIATSLNVGVIANDSVLQNANITAGQDILVRALLGDVTMAAPTFSRAGQFIIVDAAGDITLGLLDATATGRVALNAGSDIIDGNIGQAVDTNVIADQLRMVAGDFIATKILARSI